MYKSSFLDIAYRQIMGNFLKLSQHPSLGFDETDIFYLDSNDRKLYISPNNLSTPICVVDLVTKKIENKAYSKVVRKTSNIMILGVTSTKSTLCLFGRIDYHSDISYFTLQKKIDTGNDKFEIVHHKTNLRLNSWDRMQIYHIESMSKFVVISNVYGDEIEENDGFQCKIINVGSLSVEPRINIYKSFLAYQTIIFLVDFETKSIFCVDLLETKICESKVKFPSDIKIDSMYIEFVVCGDKAHLIEYCEYFSLMILAGYANGPNVCHVSMYLPDVIPMPLKSKYNDRYKMIVTGYVVDTIQNREYVPTDILCLISNFYAVIP